MNKIKHRTNFNKDKKHKTKNITPTQLTVGEQSIEFFIIDVNVSYCEKM